MRSRSRVTTVFLVLSALSLAVAGCGSNSDSSSSDSSGPIKLAFLWEVKGESSYAIQDFQDGAELALKNLNAKGGVDGRQVEYKRFAASPTDTSQSLTQYLKAMDYKPDMTIGPPGPIQEAFTPDLDRTKVPNLSISPDLQSEVGAKYGSDYRFSPATSPAALARAAAEYAVQKLGAKNIGIISSPDASDAALTDAAKQAVTEFGGAVGPEASIAVDATDATKEALQMKGSDAILIFSYEGPTGIAANQLAQDGINVPLVGYTSVYPLISDKLVDADALPNIRGVTPCGLYGTDADADAQAFVKQYQAAYGSVPSTQAATAYDSVMIAAQAVGAAKGGGSDSVLQALKTQTFTGGACGPHRSDAQQWMGEKLYVHSFASGAAELEATYTAGQ